MKLYKEEIVPEKTVSKLDKTMCDLCGNEITKERFEVDEVEIRHKTGDRYPDFGYGEQVEVDMCGECFDEKLVPWLKTQGVQAATSEWDC